MKCRSTIFALIVLGLSGYSQSASGQASLTVTVTIDSSVGLFIQPDGQEQVVVANTSDPKHSFSPVLPAAGNLSRKIPKSVISMRSPIPTVEFSLHTQAASFEIRKDTAMMDIGGAGKTEYQPVTVTTIVAK
jgi:hypothetical protein